MVATVAALLLAGCGSGERDPYHVVMDETFTSAGADSPLTDDERGELYEAMAVDLCGILRAGFESGASDAAMEQDVRDALGVGPDMAEMAHAVLVETLAHRCDSQAPDGLKAR